MAKINRGVLGTIQGSLAGLTFRNDTGRNLISKKADRTQIIYSQAQLNQQLRLANIVSFIQSNKVVFGFLPYISQSLYLNEFNTAMRRNSGSFTHLGISSVSGLFFSEGLLSASQFTESYIYVDTENLELFWSVGAIEPPANDSDTAHVFIVNLTKHTVVQVADTGLRSSEHKFYPVFHGTDYGDIVYAFMTWVSFFDSTIISDSVSTQLVLV